MFDRNTKNKTKLIQKLSSIFSEKLAADTARCVCEFAGIYCNTIPWEELSELSMDVLYGQILSCWQHLQVYSDSTANVRIYNPDLEQHGWHSPHTVIEIVHRDRSFLVDSVRLELNRQSLSIYHIHNLVLDISRDKTGQLTQISTSSEQGSQCEALIYVEVDRHTDPDRLKAIKKQIQQVLSAVDAAVGDYALVKQKLAEHKIGLKSRSGISEQELEETHIFLDWLQSGHFVFLGYELSQIDQDKNTVTRIDGSELGIARLRERSKANKQLSDFSDTARTQLLGAQLLRFTKDRYRSQVHRSAYHDLVIVKQLGARGNVIGEACFYGLYTAAAFSLQPSLIPIVRQNVKAVLSRSGLSLQGHSGKTLAAVFNNMPKEELLLCNADELYETAIGIYNLKERRRARLFIRRDPCGQFVSCLYFVPRDIFSSNLRQQVQDLMQEYFKAQSTEFTTYFSESVLARIHFVFRINPKQPLAFDSQALENLVVQVSHSWDDGLHSALVESMGEEHGNTQANLYRSAFPAVYREHFASASAVYDIQHLNALSDAQPLTMSFYRVIEQQSDMLRFKLFIPRKALILSDVIPVLENLGMRVIGEHPYQVSRNDAQRYWLHDFTLICNSDVSVDLQEVKDLFQDAFAAIWRGEAENDEFNRLVINANLSWREVAMLRAYARYNQQIRFGFSQPYIAETLTRHRAVTKLLVALFQARFDPERQSSNKVEALMLRIEQSINDALDKVDNLNDDKILRRYLELIKATVRTNYYRRLRTHEEPNVSVAIALKLDPRLILDIPLPRPESEMFIYSPRVEGVHLRGGKVARGGLRWSDRQEDYRTEVLGLFKAQQVKNAVIVPIGAKGGFVARQLPEGAKRDEIQAEGIACYKIFIRGLLDISDNIKQGKIVPPIDVVRHDGDDPYFVVAADKGTATFSDIANDISAEYDFWLGDAFASGGSQGYDHKGMGITARGAWESVKHHFQRIGHDVQSQPFSVVAIGDMGGDVFGNGMLLSKQIRLVAAFNHQHILIDPDPDPEVSFKERKRLFALSRSSWDDYNRDLIADGGGVFSRHAKRIDISEPMRSCFGITETDLQHQRMTPNQLIAAVLKAPVDLIWNGGIGTYVKAGSETHADVGDKANDNLRINGSELRCRVLGEGGNLGFTQLGRVEFDLGGGAVNTDFIDNVGGVDCSDHEVNIKILLSEVIANGDMTIKQRNQLLKSMTDEVATLVLQNNAQQVQAISLAYADASVRLDDYIRVIQQLESAGKLDRVLECLPNDEQLTERQTQGQGLTRPELSVLISYTKVELKKALINSWVPDDPYLAREIETAFPDRLVKAYSDCIDNHRLKREIIATQIANDLVNHTGVTFVHRLKEATGADYADIAAAYVISRDVFDLKSLWLQCELLGHQVAIDAQNTIRMDLIRLNYRISHWFLRNCRLEGDSAGVVACFKADIHKVSTDLSKLLQGDTLAAWQQKHGQLVAVGVPESLAAKVADAESYYSLLGIIQMLEPAGKPLMDVAAIYFELGERLGLHWFDQQIVNFNTSSHWQSLARDCYRDALDSQQRSLTMRVIQMQCDHETVQERIEAWVAQCAPRVERWQNLLNGLRSTTVNDWAIFSVAQSELTGLAR
jgi:glutamate dehydrogenase